MRDISEWLRRAGVARLRRLGVLSTAIIALSSFSSMAEMSGKISVELNALQAVDGGCRAVFVLHNGLGKALDRLSLRVVAFDGKKQASLFLSLDIGALPIDKTRVLRFELGKSAACPDISRLVLDDVTECAGGDLTPAACLAMITASSRAEVPFDW